MIWFVNSYKSNLSWLRMCRLRPSLITPTLITLIISYSSLWIHRLKMKERNWNICVCIYRLYMQSSLLAFCMLGRGVRRDYFQAKYHNMHIFEVGCILNSQPDETQRAFSKQPSTLTPCIPLKSYRWVKLRVAIHAVTGSMALACLFRTEGLQCVTVWFVCSVH